MQKFLERQQKAKLIKAEQEGVFEKHDGSRWKHEPTRLNPPKITDIII